ncbi:aquaporin-like protein [Melampsora americana]|nr:aquaporin-like protein [Melampsora americana]
MPSEKGVNLDAFLLQLKRDVVAACIEFLGTMLFLLMGLGGIQAAAVSNQASLKAAATNTGTAVNTVASIEQLLYISTSMGLSLLAAAWTFFRVSGSVFNPNVAIALLLTGALKPMRFVLYVIAELLGAIAASALLHACLPGPLAVGCALGVHTRPFQGFLIEAFLTCTLTLTVLLVAVEKHRSTPFAPVAIGLVLFASHLLGVVFTGAAMNSARAFGPSVITGFNSEHWIYWIGPSVGAVLATMIYVFLKSVDYYALTPKQDSDDIDDSPDLGGIEVKMRRRHNGLGDSTRSREKEEDTANRAPQNPLHPSFEVYRTQQAESVYPVAYGQGPTSPTVYAPSHVGVPVMRQPVSPYKNVGALVAMPGGMATSMGGAGGKEALVRCTSPPLRPTEEHDLEQGYEETALSPISPPTTRYI